MEERDVDDEHQEAQLPQDREVEPAVRERPMECGDALGPVGEGLGELDEHEAREREGRALGERPPAPQGKAEDDQVDERGPRPAEQHQEDDRAREDADARIARRAAHDVLVGGIHRQRQGGQPVGREVHVEDLHRRERKRPAEEHGSGHVRGQQVHQILLNVPEDDAPFLDRGDDGGEVVVRERHLGRFPGHVGACDAHGDADVGLLERRRVVDAVSGHGDDVARGL